VALPGAVQPEHQLVLTQPGSEPIVLKWQDGLERLADILEMGIPDAMLRRMTVAREGNVFNGYNAS